MSNTLVILGRQPALGIAEIEALYGASAVRPVGNMAATIAVEAATLSFEQLGGSIKAAHLLATLPTTEIRTIEKHLLSIFLDQANQLSEGKLTIGLSCYGLNVSPGQINALGLTIKKAIRKQTGRSVRLVPNNQADLSSAQVYHNHLTSDHAWEVILIRDGDQTVLAKTIAVQNIDSYAHRDRGRPKRDARVGMLPPKLAQILINLATGSAIPSGALTILDPFCGTGVLLQEALLMGYSVYGSDLEPRMVDYSQQNLEWLEKQLHSSLQGKHVVEAGDATDHQWQPKPDFVATEAYLGKPFTALPASDILARTVREVDLIVKKFLRNIHGQLSTDTRLCIALPAWQTAPNRFKHLPLIDQISDLGYNRVRLEHVRDDQLLYYREDQLVARELLVITRK